MNGNEIRHKFLEYFRNNSHTVVRSSSLIPINDPTLLFTNAGMNQFKDVFLGKEKKTYKRATSSQKCVRAGGKHNDLENVGYTFRHHTFFEMLGNFSFGDYFKEEAIKLAWDFLTKEVKLNPERMVATIFSGDADVERDSEAYKIWLNYLKKERIFEFGKKDNFWSMGDVGPCGPCSEIHYFQGNSIPCNEELQGRECKGVACECDRWLELWNIVFMQYNRDEKGILSPLPAPCVDTGMGLERLSAVLQGHLSNYDCDLIKPIISKEEELTGIHYGKDKEIDIAFRVIADHIRASSFLIADGVIPSNEQRGYVLRKIIRRAIRYEKKPGLKNSILTNLVDVVGEIMGDFYPEIIENCDRIKKILKREEEIFSSTLLTGMEKLEASLDQFKGRGVIEGDFLFKLYDTYGFPIDFAADIAKEKNLELDIVGFEKSMEKQREIAKQSHKKESGDDFSPILKERELKSNFVGYDNLSVKTNVIALLKDKEFVESLKKGDKGIAIFKETPFYAEGGGQVGDTGKGEGTNSSFNVLDTKKSGTIPFSIIEITEGELTLNDDVSLYVDFKKRRNTEAHHTATHILHYALRKFLGSHIKQSGSLVTPTRLRFDFSHFSSIDYDLLKDIEEEVNTIIFEDHIVKKSFMPFDDAVKYGAIALFDEKYGDIVRVVEVEGISKELCGGCHVERTSQIGIFKILEEKSVASSVRRIEAICQNSAYKEMTKDYNIVLSLKELLKVDGEKVVENVLKLVESNKRLEKELSSLKIKTLSSSKEEIEIKNVKGLNVVLKLSFNLEPSLQKNLADSLRDKIKSGVVVIGNKSDGKASILVALTKDLTDRLNASKIVKELGKVIGGGGGGSKELAEAGGKNVDRLNDALNSSLEIIGNMIDEN